MNELKKLPPDFNFDTMPILKKLIEAHRELARLNGLCASIPNQAVLVHTLAIQEAKDSSAVENIITTHADIYTAFADPEISKPAAKEILHYADALLAGFESYRKKGIVTLSCIEEIQSNIEGYKTGVRRLPGTALINDRTKEIVYEPPTPNELSSLLDNFIRIFNDNTAWEGDPLVKMAVLHFQFESIHPFYDGNGRTGRVLNVLYLVHQGLLDYPILYLSRYINMNKGLYYKYLQTVRDNDDLKAWEEYILFMLDGVLRTSRFTSKITEGLRDMMNKYKIKIRSNHPSFYSQDLINTLFSYPYIQIKILEEKLGVSYLTARKYLNALVEDKLLEPVRIGRSIFFVNIGMMDILTNTDTDSLLMYPS